MPDPLDIVWASFDAAEPLFTAEQTSSWPSAVLPVLTAIGLIVPADNADHVVCPSCDRRHVEQVILRESAGGHARFFIQCPEALRVEVPEALLLQWTVDFGAVARVVAGAMNLSGRLTQLTPNRLWRLGKATLQGVAREIFLARGLAWDDGRSVADRIGARGHPIIMVAQHLLPPGLWDARIPAVIPLPRVATLNDTSISLDLTHIWSLVHDADVEAEAAQTLPVDPKRKKLIVRQQLKAEIKSLLTDEALVAGYREHGSCRKAAEALSLQMETTISKDKVQRAVSRAGGVKAVLRDLDTGSVTRTVASQRRATTRKILHRPK